MNKQQIKEILNHVKDHQSKLNFNNTIFEIMEGDLMAHIEASLRRQFKDPENVKIAIERAAPINIWNKIIKKLSRLYSKGVVRTTENPGDQELIDYYMKKGVDKHLGNMNENYNAYKWSTIEIYEDPEIKELGFRSIPSNQFLAYSSDKINPLRPTAIIKIMGSFKQLTGAYKNKYWIYTKDEFVPVWEDETIAIEDLDGNDGLNPFEIMPFEYLSMSNYLLIPMPDKDTLKMTVLIPVLITDQNFGSLYLSFPIVYTTNADAENLPVGPNTFFNIQSSDVDKQATIGVVRAEPDLAAQMRHTLEQLNVWLESRDINASSMGNLSVTSYPSGISRAIAEIDTTENRKNQETSFSEMESTFWRRLAQIHNKLAKIGRINNRKIFSEPSKLEVTVIFPDEKIIESRADKIARLKLELDAGLTSKRRAIAEANPKMNDDEIDKLIKEIEEEKTVVIEENTENLFNEPMQEAEEEDELQSI